MASRYGPIRAYARLQMGRWARAGWSGAKIDRRLKERFGMSYKTQVLYADYREFTGMYRYEWQMRRLSGVKDVPRQWMEEIELRQARKYRLIGQATYYDTNTGKEFQKYVSMYTDDRMSKDGWTWQFGDMKRIYEYRTDWNLLDIDWEVVQHHKGWDY